MCSDLTGAPPPPLVPADLARVLVVPGGLWREIRVVASTGSTNTDLLVAAAAGAPQGTVLVAEEQTAGRGRLGRRWHAAPRAALTFSVLLRPAAVPVAHRGWVPLLTGVAAVSAVHQVAAVDAALKWPNDLLAGGRKLAGILAEQAGDAIVVGIGINVSAAPPGLPANAATSLQAEYGAPVSRERLLVAVLGELEGTYRRWTADPAGSWLRQRYLGRCATIGRVVHVELPGGRKLAGTAVDVDIHGRLVVRTGASCTAVSAGDVVHAR
jgi:BirA family biotin operon repressor/biotin-[acetyl-CoA-carboxylase] ligase